MISDIKKIKELCQPFLSSIHPNTTLFITEHDQKDIAFKTSTKNFSLNSTLEDIFESYCLLSSGGFSLSNSVVSYPTHKMNSRVFLPIGEFEYHSFKDFKTLEDINEVNSVIYSPNLDILNEHMEQFRIDLAKKIMDEISHKMNGKIRHKWKNHLIKSALDRIKKLPDTNMFKYDPYYQDELVNKWLQYYDKDINKEIDSLVDKEIREPEYQKKINDMAQKEYNKVISEINYNVISEEKAFKAFHNTLSLQEAIQENHMVFINCDEYVSIDPFYYTIMLKDNLCK